MNTQKRPTSYVTLDLALPDEQVSLSVTAGDTIRRLVVTIQDGGRPFALPRKWTVILTGTKPDRTVLYNSCVVDYSGRIVYDFAAGPNIASSIGDYTIAFEIYDEAGDKVSSPSMWLSVKPNRGTSIESINQFTAIQDILGRLNKVEDGLDFLEGDQESEYMTYEGDSLIRMNRENPSGYDVLKVSESNGYSDIVYFDATYVQVGANELQGYWVQINGESGYVGSNTTSSLTLFTSRHATTPLKITVNPGDLIYILGDDVTDDMLSVIGAAPADTGLWYKRQLTADDDMNALLENGIYTYSTSNLPANCPYENAGVVMVFGSTSATTQRIQFVFRYGDAGQGKFRAYFDGWQEWSDFGGLMESASHPGCYYRKIGSAVEWEDPTMVVGNEYRTTERWNGKPVYIKAVDCGAMPSAGNHKNITIVTGLTANHYILDMKCIFTSNIGGDYNLIRRTVNYCTDVENTTGEITGIAWAYSTTGSSSSVSVTIKAIKNISNNTAIAIVKYTK